MSGDARAFRERAKHLADRVRKARSVAIFSHIDADGVSSAAIAYRAVERLGIEPTVFFLRSLSSKEIEFINGRKDDLVWICDLGAGAYNSLDRSLCIVTDHHHIFGSGQSFLDLFGGMDNMLNPVEFGFEGSTELSGAGCTYFVAREIDPMNVDLAYLAIVGAVGDLQDRKTRRLVGPLHASVIEDALGTGILEVVENDLPFFGWATRTAAAMIAFSNDLKAIGYECTINDVNQMFRSHGVNTYRGQINESIKDDNLKKYYSWSELGSESRNILKIALRNSLESVGKDPSVLDDMLGDVYLFPSYPLGSASREAKEFATMLNASGRYLHTKADVKTPREDDSEDDLSGVDNHNRSFQGELIIKACLDPVSFSSDAMSKMDFHRDHLKKGLSNIHSVEVKKNIQVIKGRCSGESGKGSKMSVDVEDTILGTIVGMTLDQKPNEKEPRPMVRDDMPLIALAYITSDAGLSELTDSAHEISAPALKSSSGKVKVSGRMRRELADIGVHLGEAMKQAASKVNGVGGGHNVAAGATIAKNKMSVFLEALDQEIGEQKARFSSSERP